MVGRRVFYNFQVRNLFCLVLRQFSIFFLRVKNILNFIIVCYQKLKAIWNRCSSYNFIIFPKFSNLDLDRFLNLYIEKKLWEVEDFLGAHIQKNRKVKKFFYFFAKGRKIENWSTTRFFSFFGSRSFWISLIVDFSQLHSCQALVKDRKV